MSAASAMSRRKPVSREATVQPPTRKILRYIAPALAGFAAGLKSRPRANERRPFFPGFYLGQAGASAFSRFGLMLRLRWFGGELRTLALQRPLRGVLRRGPDGFLGGGPL